MVDKNKNIPQIPQKPAQVTEQNIENKNTPKYEIGVRDDILAQRQVVDNLLSVEQTKQQESEQVTSNEADAQTINEESTNSNWNFEYNMDGLESTVADDSSFDKQENGTSKWSTDFLNQNPQETNKSKEEQQTEYTIPSENVEQSPYVVNKIQNSNEQNSTVENSQELKLNNETTDDVETDGNGGNIGNDGENGNSNVNTPSTPSPTPKAPSQEAPIKEAPSQEAPPKNDRKEENNPKKDKIKIDLNKHALRFVGLLLATWAIFMVNPVLMFLALMVFEASFIMKAIELDPNSRLFKWSRKNPKTVREKQEERMIKQQEKMNKYALSSQQMDELSSLHAKGFKNLKFNEMFKRLNFARKNKKFNKAKKKFDSINNIYHYEDMLVNNVKSLVNTQAKEFNNHKNSYLQGINNNIQNRERLLDMANNGDIKLTNDQTSTLQNEIQNLSEFRDSVNAGFSNTVGENNSKLLNEIIKQPYNSDLCTQLVEHTNEDEWNASLQDYLNKSNISKPSLSPVYSEICQSNNFANTTNNEKKVTTNTNANTNINDLALN